MAVRIPTASRNAAAAAVTDRVDAGSGPGKLRFFTGAQPASANDAATGTLIGEVTLPDPSFSAGAAGTRNLADPAPAAATSAGVVGWARMLDSDNNTAMDFSVSGPGGGGDIILQNTNLAVGQQIDVLSGGTVVMPAG